jgi:hypothetical protein
VLCGLLLLLQPAWQATVPSLIGSILSLLQILTERKPSPATQSYVSLSPLLVLVSGPPWPIPFLLGRDEGELQSHRLFYGIGQARLPNLVLIMVGPQWKLCGWSEGLAELL